ncbi:CLUMA_CG016697, isoform A [Clunio marinus]|uniref:CLUMA_CG016697, isoform A n=1 Tax=Clunio marinus TaxID=568069 RepID=A0A1J1ISA7_9DIPT|nr:CLUMA_CG016697, isoform A [Clunio marinus]
MYPDVPIYGLNLELKFKSFFPSHAALIESLITEHEILDKKTCSFNTSGDGVPNPKIFMRLHKKTSEKQNFILVKLETRRKDR